MRDHKNHQESGRRPCYGIFEQLWRIWVLSAVGGWLQGLKGDHLWACSCCLQLCLHLMLPWLFVLRDNEILLRTGSNLTEAAQVSVETISIFFEKRKRLHQRAAVRPCYLI